MQTGLKINEISKRSKVTIETIRYYEKIGVLPQPQRAENGYRIYDPHILVHLEFIKNCRSLGFSIEEIKQLDELRKSPFADCKPADDMIAIHLKQVQEQIAQLQKIEAFLLDLSHCHEHNVKTCKVMTKLDKHRGGHEHDYYEDVE